MAELQRLYLACESELRLKFGRSLPFQDAIFDRWERAKRLGFDERASIYNSALVFGDVHVGRGSWIGPYTVLDGSGGPLRIGAFCSISAGVHIYTHDTVKWALSGGKAEYEHAQVGIGDCCYIGSQTVIAKGVTIGDHCVIGACSFVNKDIPPHTVAGGVPFRCLGRVEIDERGDVALVLDKRWEESGL